jgi:hypothetical protein
MHVIVSRELLTTVLPRANAASFQVSEHLIRSGLPARIANDKDDRDGVANLRELLLA